MRGKPNHSSDPIDLAYWIDRNFNTVEDRTILRHSDAIDDGITALLRDPEIDRLHRHGVNWRRRRIAEMLQDIDTFHLLSRLMQLGSTQVLPEAQQIQLFKDLIKVRKLEIMSKQ